MVRLPKHVAEAKAEFEANNKIKDIINNPRKIIPSTPADVILEYENPQVAMLCQKKLLEYNALALSVRTKIMGLSPYANKVAQQVAALLAQYVKGLALFPEVNPNFAPGTFGDFSKFNPNIPECLKETSKLAEGLKSIAGDFAKLFSGDAETASMIDEIVKSIKTKNSTIGNMLSQGIDTDAIKIGLIVKTFNDAFNLVQNEIQKVFFKLFDVLKLTIDKSGLGKDIAKLRQYHSCLTSHCKPNLKYMVDVSDVLPDMTPNLPIDPYSGEFRPYRLFIYGDTYPELVSSEGSRALSEVDSDYAVYIEMKKEKMNELSQNANIGLNVGDLI